MPLYQRANSSPNLRVSGLSKGVSRQLYGDRDNYDDDHHHHHYDNRHDETEFFVIGDRVYVDGHRRASVAYFGETEFASGDWVGVVLDEPTGNHAGKLHGREYFQCAPNHGLFVRAHRLARASDSALGSSATSSRCGTPLPTANTNYQRFKYTQASHKPLPLATGGGGPQTPRASSRASTGSSLLDSYYYDDDYRQDAQMCPTIGSLTRKLKSIDERRPDSQMVGRYDFGERPESRASRGPSQRQQPVVGILKRPSRWSSQADANGSAQNLSARVDELDRRLRASSASPSPTVFNFRPRREQLDGYGETTARPRQRSVHLFGEEPVQKGDRVVIRTEREGELTGLLRFMGETNFATGEWAGVELDEPVGKNDGAILGHRYFHCPDNYGLFVPASRVKRYDPERHGSIGQYRQLYGSQPSIFSSMRSTIKSPPPRLTSLTSPASRQSDGSRSTTPSYNMDTLSPASRQSSSMSANVGRPYAHYSRPTSTDLDQLSPEPPRRKLTSLVSDYATSRREAFDNHDDWRDRRATATKFDDHDIDLKLRQSLNRSQRVANGFRSSPSPSPTTSAHRPKAVEYTFISNKLDGQPIARRTLIYE